MLCLSKPCTYTTAGVPHRVMEDDVYQGMFIPKGATIVANTRSVYSDV